MARRRLRPLALAVVAAVAVDQALLWTVLGDGELLGHPVAPYAPPLFTSGQESLLRRYEGWLEEPRVFERRSLFDPELGWCPRPGMRRGSREYDRVGARVGIAPLPEERPAGSRLVALVGCSFTEGHEVEGDESWAARLEEEHEDLLVANLGVGGYGVDQALLRARRDALPIAPDEVWLGFFPGGVLRSTTHFPPIQNKWARGVLFKPRFVLAADGALELVESPAREPSDVPRLLHDQRALFEAVAETDLWVRRVPAAFAPLGSRWVHRTALGRLVMTWREHGDREIAPWLRDETSEVFRLHRALVLALRDEVAARGARFRLVVLPSGLALAQRARDGRGYWEGLTDELRAAGVEVLDASKALQAAGGAEEPGLWMPEGHYSPEANAVVAREIAERWLGR